MQGLQDGANFWAGMCNKDYLKRSLNQVVLGNYTEDVTLLGTAGQIGLGFTGIDFVGDLRDLSADIKDWKWTWSHAGKTALDGIGLIPVIGAVKNIDEVGTLIKQGFKNAYEVGNVKKVIKVADQTSGFNEGIDFIGDTGRLGGNLYGEKRLNQLSKYLDKRGIKLEINDEFLNSRNANGGFDAVNGKLILKSDATEYEVWHELSHYIQYKKLGKESYLELPRTTDFNAPEQYVFDMLENNKRRWAEQLTEEERIHASEYIYRAGGLR